MERPARPASIQLPVKGERVMFASSDDNAMMKQILAIHAPDGREINVKLILQIVEDIFSSATLATSDGEIRDAESKQGDDAADLELLAFIVNRLSCEMSYMCMGGKDIHSTTVSLFNILSSYSWVAKLVLTLAAFALNYGEFWLLSQIYSTNKLANKMSILKQLPNMTEHSALLKPRFDALDSLIKSIMDLTRCIVELTELPLKYISLDDPQHSTVVSTIPVAVYWIFRSVLSCVNNIISLSGMGHEFITSTAETWELSSLNHKNKTIYEHLKKQLVLCYQQIEEKKNLEAYDALLHTFETIHLDNMKVLKSLIYPKDDIMPLFDGSSRKQVSLDVLRRKTVLLLISVLNVSGDVLSLLYHVYNESRSQPTGLESQYEIVWIPCIDRSSAWTEASQTQFESLKSEMPWYTVHHPSLIDQAVIRYIKEILHFKNKPILVVLDIQGKIVSPNALHMMWIWGSTAFPFTSAREEALWKEETWRLELLVDAINAPVVLDWMREGKSIILYGGGDLEWIRNFTATAKLVAQRVRIALEMVYVRKSNEPELVREITFDIQRENISYTLNDIAYTWFFWTRLESMLFSKIQLRSVDEGDPVLREIKKLLSYDKSGSWAIYSRGPNIAINGFGTTVLSALKNFDKWETDAKEKGFDAAFKEYYEKLHDKYHPCCRLEFPSTAGRTPDNMKCPECHRFMEKFQTFSCCHDTPM